MMEVAAKTLPEQSSRQIITTNTQHFFNRPDALPVAQPTASGH